MKVLSLLIFTLSAVLVACASVPKPRTSPEDEAGAVYRSRGEVYQELCETTCSLPGLFGEEEALARKTKVEKAAEITAASSGDAVSAVSSGE